MSMEGAFFIAMAGAFVGGLLSLLVQRWRYSADQWAYRTSEFCEEITKLADEASAFWLVDRKKEDAELAASLVRVRGGLLRISALQLPFQDWCMRNDAVQLEKLIGKLATAISGGDFLKLTRKADSERAFDIQAAAADLICHLHTSRISAATIRASFVRIVLRRLDLKSNP